MQGETDVRFKGHMYVIFYPFVVMIVLKTYYKVLSLNYINIPDMYPFVFDLNHDIKVMGVKSGGTGDMSPAIKIAGEGRTPPKICMKSSHSDYFNGFKLDPFKLHHNFSIVVAILDRTKPIHVLSSAIKTHVIPLIRPERDL